MTEFNRAFNAEEVARLKRLIDDGVQTAYEVDALKVGMRETVKAHAEELDIKASILNKAISIAHKAKFQDAQHDFDALETILDAVGKTM